MSYFFVPECNHAQESQTYIFFLFSLSYLQDHGLLISRDYATMVTRPNDFSSPLVYDLMEPRPIIKINKNILGMSKTELDIFGVGSNC